MWLFHSENDVVLMFVLVEALLFCRILLRGKEFHQLQAMLHHIPILFIVFKFAWPGCKTRRQRKERKENTRKENIRMGCLRFYPGL